MSRVIRVFLSSTFEDFQQERDDLHAKVFPFLRKFSSSKGLLFNEVDLRWGVVESKDAVQVCLKEVQRCRPYIVCLLGDRYGWVPTKEELQDAIAQVQNDIHAFDLAWVLDHVGCSMTHLEIIQGIVRVPEQDRHALVYIRTQTPTSVVLRKEEASSKQKLQQLKEYVATLPGVTCRTYDDPDQLPDMVKEDLQTNIECLSEQLALQILGSASTSNPHAMHAQANQACYALPSSLAILRDELLGQALNEPVVIVGQSGCGKSSFVAQLLLHWQQDEKHEAFVHFTGLAGPNNLYTTVLHRLLSQLKLWSQGQIQEPIPVDVKNMTSKVFEWVHTVASANCDKEYIFLVDAVNQLLDIDTAANLRWLPMIWPSNCRLIVTSIDVPPQWEFQIRRLESLTTQDRAHILETYLSLAGKTMLPEQSQLIIDSDHITSPLHLRVMLDELRVTGVFHELTDNIRSLVAAPSISEVFEKVLVRWEKTYNSLATPISWTYVPVDRDADEINSPADWHLVGAMLSLIACAPDGIMEHELWAILGVKQADVTLLFHAVAEIIDSADGLVKFAHSAFDEAVREKYVSVYGEKQIHAALAGYFTCLPMDDARKIAMLPGYALSLGDADGVGRYLSHPVVFEKYSGDIDNMERQWLWRQVPLSYATGWLEKMLEDMLRRFIAQTNGAAEEDVPKPFLPPEPEFLDGCMYVEAKQDGARRRSRLTKRSTRSMLHVVEFEGAQVLPQHLVALVQAMHDVGALFHRIGEYPAAQPFYVWALTVCVSGLCRQAAATIPISELVEQVSSKFDASNTIVYEGGQVLFRLPSLHLSESADDQESFDGVEQLPVIAAKVLFSVGQLSMHSWLMDEAQRCMKVALAVHKNWSLDEERYVVMSGEFAWTLLSQNQIIGEGGAIQTLKHAIAFLATDALADIGIVKQNLPTDTDELDGDWVKLFDGLVSICNQGKKYFIPTKLLPILNRFVVAQSRVLPYEVGQQLFSASLIIHEALVGDTNPLVASVHADLGQYALSQAHNVKEQRDIVKETDKDVEASSGVKGDHAVVPSLYAEGESTSKSDLGHSVGETLQGAELNSEFEKLVSTARIHITKAISIRTQLLGPQHPFVATLHASWGELCSLQGQTREAASAFGRAYSVRLTAFGPDNPQTKRVQQLFKNHSESTLDLTSVQPPPRSPDTTSRDADRRESCRW
eukprot:m.170253 g.170253  ORF g.170253 m.170253 type:complete len:1191 (+) comp14526_c0_seq2:97-3669(+)